MTGSTPTLRRCGAGPMPDNIKICGVLKAPPETITSRAAPARSTRPPLTYETPVAVVPRRITRVTTARRSTVRLGRRIAGLRNAVAAEERRPVWLVYWLRPKPSGDAAL